MWNKIILKIISGFYFTSNRVWYWNKIISAADGVVELFQNYFSHMNTLENIHELQ